MVVERNEMSFFRSHQNQRFRVWLKQTHTKNNNIYVVGQLSLHPWNRRETLVRFHSLHLDKDVLQSYGVITRLLVDYQIISLMFGHMWLNIINLFGHTGPNISEIFGPVWPNISLMFGKPEPYRSIEILFLLKNPPKILKNTLQ